MGPCHVSAWLSPIPVVPCFVCTGLMTLGHTPRCLCSSVSALGLAHPPAPLPARLGCGQKHPPSPRSFYFPPLCQCLPWGPSVPLEDDGVRHRDRNRDRDRKGDGAERCFPAEITWHSLTHRPGDGSWFQLHPPGVQSWFPAWVTMGTAGWGKLQGGGRS